MVSSAGVSAAGGGKPGSVSVGLGARCELDTAGAGGGEIASDFVVIGLLSWFTTLAAGVPDATVPGDADSSDALAVALLSPVELFGSVLVVTGLAVSSPFSSDVAAPALSAPELVTSALLGGDE